MSGRFITLEGGEGAGKTTQIGYINRYLQQRGIATIVTREPGGTCLGEEIRTLVLGQQHKDMDLMTETLLMFAARSEHLQKVILPALAAGDWVLCDRFTDATYAYQGGGRGLETAQILQMEQLVQGELRPDLTILLDVPVAVGLDRIQQRGEVDRFEEKDRTFYARVREAYLQRAKQHPLRYRVVDAQPSLEQVRLEIERILHEWLEYV